MTENKRKRLLISGALILLGALLTVAIVRELAPQEAPVIRGPIDIDLEAVYPQATATPNPYRPGIVLVRNQYYTGGVTMTPAPGVVGSHIDIGWNDIQPNITATPDWRGAETAVAYANANGYCAWLSIQYFQNNYGGLDIITAPSGVPTVSYTVNRNTSGTPTPCSTEVAPDYGSTTFRNAQATVVASLTNKFGNDARVCGFAIQAGASGEVMNVQADNCAYKKYWFEQVVTCDKFTDYVTNLAGWYRAGTNKPVTLALGIDACYQTSFNRDRKSNKYFLEKLNGANGATPTSTPLYIAYRHNGGNPDSAASMYGTPTPGPWGRYQPGYALPQQGGIAFEPGSPYGFPSQVPTPDREGYADYMMLNMAAANADWIFLQKEWLPYIDSTVYNVITQTLGTTAANSPIAWVWFREAEFKSNVDGGGYTYSGKPGPFTHLASVRGAATPTTYCSPNVRATAQAMGGSTPPNACSSELSSPAARESRNALGYNASATVGIDIADDWQYAGNVNNSYTLALRYLDNNSGSIVVAWKDTGGIESTYTIDKTSSGAWTTAAFQITAALNDGFGGHDIEIRAVDAQAVLNSLIVDYGASVSTPTPGPTSTMTPTPGAGAQLYVMSYADTNNNRTYNAGTDTPLAGNFYVIYEPNGTSGLLCDTTGLNDPGTGCYYPVTPGVPYGISAYNGYYPLTNYVAAVTPPVGQGTEVVRTVTAQPTTSGTPVPVAFAYVTVTPQNTPTATVSPMPTATVTRTPYYTNTPTPRPTMTAVTPTATRTPTATPDWVTLNCAAITPVIDGALLEWSGAAPVVVDSTTANIIQPATPAVTYTVTPTGTPPPQSADSKGTFYCGYNGSDIILGGAVLDDVTTLGVTYQAAGSIASGDSVRITLDGAGDGLADIGGDDLELYLDPAGRLLNWDTMPISATVRTQRTTGAWTFEILLASSQLELGTLTSGARWGGVFEVRDADTANGIEHIMTDRKRWLTIP